MRSLPLLVLIAAALAVPAATQASPSAVSYQVQYAPGTIIVRTSERRLYLVVAPGKALRYTVGVGRAGKQWSGSARIVAKFIKPAWSPPAEVKRDNPRLPDLIAGGSPSNPMGAAAMVLTGGEYAIHGTNRPGSIGGFVSYGCIRMYNADILDLYSRVSVGTPVVVAR
ncbi:MAG TPA: L,D-transpeptidase [Bauldia sp.]|nr:L,D-transpeptidase [Bauldia sp.]